MVNQINTSQPQVTTTGAALERVASQPVASTPRVTPKREREQSSLERQPLATGHRRRELADTKLQHQQAAHAQSAVAALKEAVTLLEQLRQTARRSLQARENEKQQLQQSLGHLKSRLTRLIKESRYDGEPVLHHDLSPRLRGSNEQHNFTVKGLRLNGWRSQDEVVRFQFDHGQPTAVRARIRWDDTPKAVAETLNKALAPRDIQVGLDKYGELAFTIDKGRWTEVKSGIWVSGNGQMLPAGNPVKAKVELQDKQSTDPEALDFSKPEATRNALADIERLLQKIRYSLQALDEKQKQLETELAQSMAARPLVRGHTAGSHTGLVAEDGSIEASWFELPQDITLLLVNNAVPTLLAQANATRHNVVSLLDTGNNH